MISFLPSIVVGAWFPTLNIQVYINFLKGLLVKVNVRPRIKIEPIVDIDLEIEAKHKTSIGVRDLGVTEPAK